MEIESAFYGRDVVEEWSGELAVLDCLTMHFPCSSYYSFYP